MYKNQLEQFILYNIDNKFDWSLFSILDKIKSAKCTLIIFVKFTNIYPYTILILLYFRHEITYKYIKWLIFFSYKCE